MVPWLRGVWTANGTPKRPKRGARVASAQGRPRRLLEAHMGGQRLQNGGPGRPEGSKGVPKGSHRKPKTEFGRECKGKGKMRICRKPKKTRDNQCFSKVRGVQGLPRAQRCLLSEKPRIDQLGGRSTFQTIRPPSKVLVLHVAVWQHSK